MSKSAGITIDPDAPRRLRPEQVAELNRLAALDDADIDFGDVPPVDFSNAISFRDRHLYKPVKRSTTVRIDADVLQWLRAQGKGYQTRLNAILREAMLRDG